MQALSAEERRTIFAEARAAIFQDDYDGAFEHFKKIPLGIPYVKSLLYTMGAEKLLASGINFSEVEERYGKDWVTKL